MNNKNQPQKWRDELLRLFGELQSDWSTHTDWEKYGKPGFDKIAELISQVEQQAIQKERDRVVEILEGCVIGFREGNAFKDFTKEAIKAIKEEKHLHSFGRDAVTGVYVCMECGMESAYKP